MVCSCKASGLWRIEPPVTLRSQLLTPDAASSRSSEEFQERLSCIGLWVQTTSWMKSLRQLTDSETWFLNLNMAITSTCQRLLWESGDITPMKCVSGTSDKGTL